MRQARASPLHALLHDLLVVRQGRRERLFRRRGIHAGDSRCRRLSFSVRQRAEAAHLLNGREERATLRLVDYVLETLPDVPRISLP